MLVRARAQNLCARAYLATMHQTICKIRYDLDLAHISPNGWRDPKNSAVERVRFR